MKGTTVASIIIYSHNDQHTQKMALTLYDPHDLLLGHLPHSYIGMKLSTHFEELQTILELSPCFLSAGQLLFPGGTLYIFCSSPVNIKEYSSHKQPQT